MHASHRASDGNPLPKEQEVPGTPYAIELNRFAVGIIAVAHPRVGGSGRGHPLPDTWETWMAPMSCQPSSSSNRPR